MTLSLTLCVGSLHMTVQISKRQKKKKSNFLGYPPDLVNQKAEMVGGLP